MSEALAVGFKAAQVTEALANYALADQLYSEPLQRRDSRTIHRYEDGDEFRDDEICWQTLFYQSREPSRRSRNFRIECGAISEWVARIPGLYWLPGSKKMRDVNPAQIESKSREWLTYTPRGKSQKVSGGIGTLRFPPAENGYRLVTITTSLNASSGVPALVSPDVWEHHRLAEGCLITGSVGWRNMPLQWATQFPVIQNLPRPCIVLDEPDDIHVHREQAPVQVHPFTVMEYWDGDVRLHDFVYATADTRQRDFHRNVSLFFERYRKEQNRDGTFFISADMCDPMWDATFSSPEEMRRHKGAELRLIQRRIEDQAKGKDTIEALIRKLSQVATVEQLKFLSSKAGIPPNRWFSLGSLGDAATHLVDAAVEMNKQQALLYAVQLLF